VTVTSTTWQITSEHGAQRSEPRQRRRQHNWLISSSRASKWRSRNSAYCPRPRKWRRSNFSGFFRSQVVIMSIFITYTPTSCKRCTLWCPQKEQFQRSLQVCSLSAPSPPLHFFQIRVPFLVLARACQLEGHPSSKNVTNESFHASVSLSLSFSLLSLLSLSLTLCLSLKLVVYARVFDFTMHTRLIMLESPRTPSLSSGSRR